MAERRKKSSPAPTHATRGRKPIDKNETPEEKFRRLANSRVFGALKRISQIGNLASPQYRYSPEQATKIRHKIEDAVLVALDKLDARFRAQVEKEKESFNLF